MDEKETLGSYLKNQRESKKISLREVAKNTRVREHILRAIEEDQHNLLPPSTYVKGFLFAYAKYLRIDPSDVLLRYERDLRGESVSPPHTEPRRPKQKTPPAQPPEPKEKIPPTQPPKSKQKILWNMKQTGVVVAVIVASLIGFYFFSPYSSKPPVEPVPEKPVSEGKPAVEKKQPLPPSPAAPAIPSVPEKKPLSLQLKAVEETWVSLLVDDQPGKEMTLKPGEGVSVQASNRVRMVVGNAGGLDLTLNGKPLEKFGKSGQVLTLVFTSQGVEVKRPEKPKLP
jgi:cytoskeleton protein RodZ